MYPGSVNKALSNSAICVQCYTSFSRAKHAGLFWQATVSEEERLSESHLPSSGRKRYSPPSCLFSDRSFQTLFPTETLDGTFSGADGSQPPGRVRYFHSGGCEIPLLEGSRVPRVQAVEGYVKQQQLLHDLPSDTLSLMWRSSQHMFARGGLSKAGVQPESGFRKSEQQDPHPFAANRNVLADFMGPRI